MSRFTSLQRTTESRLSRRRFLGVGAGALGSVLVSAYSARARELASEGAGRISTADLGGVQLLQGAGTNVIAMSGAEGALMIDGGLAANADPLLATVRSATAVNRIHTLVN